MKSSILTFFLSLILATSLAHGATINVGAGENLQTAIENASAGDTIQLTAPGNYSGDLNITKPIKMISWHRDNHNIAGQIYVSNLTTDEKVTFKNISITGKVNVRSSSLDLIRCHLHEINATNPTGFDTQLTIVQSNISDKLSSALSRTWVGYSNLGENYFEGKIELVGNDINGKNLGGIGIDLRGDQTNAQIYNNLIHNFKAEVNAESCIGIRIDGNASAVIRNNSIYDNMNDLYLGAKWYQTGIGILVKSTRSTEIVANKFKGNVTLYGSQGATKGSMHIYSASPNISIRHNSFANHEWFSSQVKPLGIFGATAYESITDTNLNETEFLASTTSMALGKPSQNTGPAGSLYFDHDGSRNDIGPNGGRNYIPNGRTTDKPIPIFFTIEPQVVPTNGKVTINSTGAVLK
jgi:hypothetical protein